MVCVFKLWREAVFTIVLLYSIAGLTPPSLCSFSVVVRENACNIIITIFLCFFSFQNNPKNLDPSLGLFRKGKTCIIAKFHRTDLVICGHSRQEKPIL